VFKKEASNPNIRMLSGDYFAGQKDKRIKEYRKKWEDNPRRHEAGIFPVHLDIESTSICNLKCPFCATAHSNYSPGYMTMDVYRRILDEACLNGLYSVKLNFRGEPLLNPELGNFVSYAKEKGIVDVFFNTNATLLTEDASRVLITSGLDRLIVSFEGYTKDVYERHRVGADFDKVVLNIRNFVKIKNRYRSRKVILRLQTVDVKDEDFSLEGYKAFWKDIADEITCIDLRDEISDHSLIQDSKWACPYLWRRLCVTWNGDILTCPFMNKEIEMYKWKGFGNIAERSIKDVWNCSDMIKLRDTHLMGRSHTVEPCKWCSYRSEEIMKGIR